MPIFEFACRECGQIYEAIMLGSGGVPRCPYCSSDKGEKLISASSSSTGRPASGVPGRGDHGCCGDTPGSRGCVPGSCCGKA